MTSAKNSAGDTVGRPRDPVVDHRIARSTLSLYGRLGWARFSIEAVARESGISKASIYRRWPHRELLLTQTLAARFSPLAEIDTGDVRGDLAALARLLLDLYGGEDGPAARRMTIEADVVPEIAPHWRTVRASLVKTSRAIVRRAIERRELHPDCDTTVVLDTLCGAAILHDTALPDTAGPTESDYVERLVDFVLAGAGSSSTR